MIKEKFEVLTENEILTYFSELAEPLLESKGKLTPNETIDYILRKLDYIKCNNEYLIVTDNNHIEYNKNHNIITLISNHNTRFKIYCENYEIPVDYLYDNFLICDLEDFVLYLN